MLCNNLINPIITPDIAPREPSARRGLRSNPAGPGASGDHAKTAKERNARLHKNENIIVETIIDVDDLLAANEVTLENEYNNDDDIQVSDYMSSPPEQFSNAKKYKTNAIQEGNRILERVYHQEYTGEEIYKQLEPMCLPPNELPDAMMFLAENQAKARMLYSCPFEIRMEQHQASLRIGENAAFSLLIRRDLPSSYCNFSADTGLTTRIELPKLLTGLDYDETT
ncbi:hypothetical protein E3N88_40227 [Mikania micrantha]|uniref:Uncharacterized protein n=1 Tax=Mikania micrantha TaxID=192012 RepID=A0A5N6LM03_9ASTR|nr:hypothetical protein E3N88_40227 [Mikania micrantha]